MMPLDRASGPMMAYREAAHLTGKQKRKQQRPKKQGNRDQKHFALYRTKRFLIFRSLLAQQLIFFISSRNIASTFQKLNVSNLVTLWKIGPEKKAITPPFIFCC